jgi:hypothetical protein
MSNPDAVKVAQAILKEVENIDTTQHTSKVTGFAFSEEFVDEYVKELRVAEGMDLNRAALASNLKTFIKHVAEIAENHRCNYTPENIVPVMASDLFLTSHSALMILGKIMMKDLKELHRCLQEAGQLEPLFEEINAHFDLKEEAIISAEMTGKGTVLHLDAFAYIGIWSVYANEAYQNIKANEFEHGLKGLTESVPSKLLILENKLDQIISMLACMDKGASSRGAEMWVERPGFIIEEDVQINDMSMNERFDDWMPPNGASVKRGEKEGVSAYGNAGSGGNEGSGAMGNWF